jgi:hypothetical protein
MRNIVFRSANKKVRDIAKWQLVIYLIRRGTKNVKILHNHQKMSLLVAWWSEKLAKDLKKLNFLRRH